MSSTRLLVPVIFLTAFITAACSSSSSGSDDAPASTDAATYADGVCQALIDWQSGLETDNEALQAELAGTPAPEGSKTALVDFLSATVDGTKTMVADIEALGVPDIEAGDEVASALSTELGKVVTVFEGALDEVESLSTEDPQAMAAALGELGTNISEGTSGISTALGDLDTPELEEAAKDSTACQEIGV